MEYISGYSNKKEIINLWKHSFGDEEPYINLFLDNYYKPEYCFGVVEENSLVSMAFLLPTTLKTKEKSYIGRYVYAVATSLNFRGQGISKKLLAFAEKEMVNRNVEFLTLVPATESLFNFYKTQGFINYFYISKKTFKKQENFTEHINLKKADIDSIFTHRERFFSDADSFCSWDKNFLSYIQKENSYLNGDIFEFENGYMVCYLDNSAVEIKELVCPQNIRENAILTAIEYYNAHTAIIREKADKANNNTIPFGMIKALKPINLQEQGEYLPYISLVLD